MSVSIIDIQRRIDILVKAIDNDIEMYGILIKELSEQRRMIYDLIKLKKD